MSLNSFNLQFLQKTNGPNKKGIYDVPLPNNYNISSQLPQRHPSANSCLRQPLPLTPRPKTFTTQNDYVSTTKTNLIEPVPMIHSLIKKVLADKITLKRGLFQNDYVYIYPDSESLKRIQITDKNTPFYSQKFGLNPKIAQDNFTMTRFNQDDFRQVVKRRDMVMESNDQRGYFRDRDLGTWVWKDTAVIGNNNISMKRSDDCKSDIIGLNESETNKEFSDASSSTPSQQELPDQNTQRPASNVTIDRRIDSKNRNIQNYIPGEGTATKPSELTTYALKKVPFDPDCKIQTPYINFRSRRRVLLHYIAQQDNLTNSSERTNEYNLRTNGHNLWKFCVPSQGDNIVKIHDIYVNAQKVADMSKAERNSRKNLILSSFQLNKSDRDRIARNLEDDSGNLTIPFFYVVMEKGDMDLYSYLRMRLEWSKESIREKFSMVRQCINAVYHCHNLGICHRAINLKNFILINLGAQIQPRFYDQSDNNSNNHANNSVNNSFFVHYRKDKTLKHHLKLTNFGKAKEFEFRRDGMTNDETVVTKNSLVTRLHPVPGSSGLNDLQGSIDPMITTQSKDEEIKPYSHRCDIYALGRVIIEILTGFDRADKLKEAFTKAETMTSESQKLDQKMTNDLVGLTWKEFRNLSNSDQIHKFKANQQIKCYSELRLQELDDPKTFPELVDNANWSIFRRAVMECFNYKENNRPTAQTLLRLVDDILNDSEFKNCSNENSSPDDTSSNAIISVGRESINQRFSRRNSLSNCSNLSNEIELGMDDSKPIEKKVERQITDSQKLKNELQRDHENENYRSHNKQPKLEIPTDHRSTTCIINDQKEMSDFRLNHLLSNSDGNNSDNISQPSTTNQINKFENNELEIQKFDNILDSKFKNQGLLVTPNKVFDNIRDGDYNGSLLTLSNMTTPMPLGLDSYQVNPSDLHNNYGQSSILPTHGKSDSQNQNQNSMKEMESLHEIDAYSSHLDRWMDITVYDNQPTDNHVNYLPIPERYGRVDDQAKNSKTNLLSCYDTDTLVLSKPKKKKLMGGLHSSKKI